MVTCPICKSSSEKLFDGHDRLMHVSGSFEIRECVECKVLFTTPRLSRREMAVYYPDGYNLSGKSIELLLPLDRMSGRHKRILRGSTQKKYELITSVGGNGKLLDIGCNLGHFLFGMRMLGWGELYGLEPRASAAKYAEKSLGVKIWTDAFPDIYSLPVNGFDVITLWHVFEHIADPGLALDTIRQLLSPNGICVINMPNPDSLDRQLFQEAWVGLDVPRHYFSFPPGSFRNLAGKHGFFVVAERFVDDPHGSTLLCISFLLNESIYALAWAPLRRILSTGIVGLLIRPVYLILERMGWQPSLAYVLKKIDSK